jgi:hypothetical protein
MARKVIWADAAADCFSANFAPPVSTSHFLSFWPSSPTSFQASKLSSFFVPFSYQLRAISYELASKMHPMSYHL